MRGGVSVNASPHLRPLVVSQMDEMTHKIAVHIRSPDAVQSKIDVCCVQNAFNLFVCLTLYVDIFSRR
jgi:hypothetical protein